VLSDVLGYDAQQISSLQQARVVGGPAVNP
jgi:hypothetical protein